MLRALRWCDFPALQEAWQLKPQSIGVSDILESLYCWASGARLPGGDNVRTVCEADWLVWYSHANLLGVNAVDVVNRNGQYIDISVQTCS